MNTLINPFHYLKASRNAILHLVVAGTAIGVFTALSAGGCNPVVPLPFLAMQATKPPG